MQTDVQAAWAQSTSQASLRELGSQQIAGSPGFPVPTRKIKYSGSARRIGRFAPHAHAQNCQLENNLQPELNLSFRRLRRIDHAEALDRLPCRVQGLEKAAVNRSEVRMIKQIEEFGPELDVKGL